MDAFGTDTFRVLSEESGKLRETAKLVDAGRVKPNLDPGRYCLDSVMDAYLAIEQREAVELRVVDEMGFAAIAARLGKRQMATRERQS